MVNVHPCVVPAFLKMKCDVIIFPSRFTGPSLGLVVYMYVRTYVHGILVNLLQVFGPFCQIIQVSVHYVPVSILTNWCTILMSDKRIW